MRQSLILILILVSAMSGNTANATKRKTMKVYLSFDPVKTNIKMRIYKLPIEKALDIGEITYNSMAEKMPAYQSLDSGFELKKGAVQAFLMVAENPTNEPIYFFGVAHTVVPEQAGVGFKLGCLCNNHIFDIPPKSRWMRVGSLTLEQYAQGTEVRFVHKIVGMTKETIKEKGLFVNGVK